MITYNRSAFGWNLIFKFHGSAIYRSVFPALIAVAFFFLYDAYVKLYIVDGKLETNVLHPYAVGVLVTTSTFLIVFRLNQSYSRYWEACGSTHHFISKWLDATTHTSIYHMQCDHYNHIKPPTFYDHPELNFLFMTRERERHNFSSTYAGDTDVASDGPDHETGMGLRNRKYPQASQTQTQVPDVPPPRVFGVGKVDTSVPSGDGSGEYSRDGISSGSISEEKAKKMRRNELKEEYIRRSSIKSINQIDSSKYNRKASRRSDWQNKTGGRSVCSLHSVMEKSVRHTDGKTMEMNALYEESVFHSFGSEPIPLVGKPRMDGNWGTYYSTNPKQPLSTFVDPLRPDVSDRKGFASIQGNRTPPLFLQELAHLSSLLTAVALSTLRNDKEGCESPLSIYEPGQPWPEVNPIKDKVLKGEGIASLLTQIKIFLGVGLTAEQRSQLNASLPLPVIGGVSDAEIRFLQMARGPSAKTQLCFSWLSEFIVREHLAGSLGKVGPPIISRIFQFLGDGMIYYNHARKIMFIPFPFGHAQLSIFYVYFMKIVIPYLMHEWTDDKLIGALLTFLTVLCIEGINEVARDLENPFRNFPNELPLVNIMAQFNEGLMTMYAGYHPDSFWDGQQVMDIAQSSGRGVTTTKEESGGSRVETKTTPDVFVEKPAVITPLNNTEGDTTDVAALKERIAYQAKLIDELYAKVDDICAMGRDGSNASN